jgi:serine/threonine protein kinase
MMKEHFPFVEVRSKKYFKRYMSPEMILKGGHDRCVDFYGMGALLYEMIYGFPPFYC